jgi:hypothetical protein
MNAQSGILRLHGVVEARPLLSEGKWFYDEVRRIMRAV